MSFRRRMVLLAAGAVAAAVVLASVVVYVVTGDELRSGIDSSLRAKVTPGLPQSVQILAKVSPKEMARLKREGRLAAGRVRTAGRRVVGRCPGTGGSATEPERLRQSRGV